MRKKEGHYTGKATMHKIMHIGLWWPTIFRDTKEYCETYDRCQRVGKPFRRDKTPLNPYVMLQSFDKWVIDFIGLINPPTWRYGAQYIIIMTDYLTRWVEVVAIKDCSAETLTYFLFENVVMRFGFQRILMGD